MTKNFVAAAFAASLFAGAAPAAQAQGLGSIFNCNRPGSAQTPGAVIGGVLGGLAGVGVARNDTLGGLLGAAVGAAAGSWIGCNLVGQDQVSLEQATLQALNEGRNTTWNNASTGASARINVYADTTPTASSPYAPRYGQPLARTQVPLATRVNAAAGFETVAPRYTALGQTYIRLSPDYSASTNGFLNRGEEFQALAKVQNSDWILVGRNGMGVGYVPASSVQASVETITAGFSPQPLSRQSVRLQRDVSWATAYETVPNMYRVSSTTFLRASPSAQARTLGQIFRDDEVETIARVQGTSWILVGRNGEGVGYVPDNVLQPLQQSSYAPQYAVAPSDCRIVEQIVTTRQYGTQTERLRACRDPAGGAAGAWTFAAV